MEVAKEYIVEPPRPGCEIVAYDQYSFNDEAIFPEVERKALAITQMSKTFIHSTYQVIDRSAYPQIRQKLSLMPNF